MRMWKRNSWRLLKSFHHRKSSRTDCGLFYICNTHEIKGERGELVRARECYAKSIWNGVLENIVEKLLDLYIRAHACACVWLLGSLFRILANLIPCSLICWKLYIFENIRAAIARPYFFLAQMYLISLHHFWFNTFFFLILIAHTIVSKK